MTLIEMFLCACAHLLCCLMANQYISEGSSLTPLWGGLFWGNLAFAGGYALEMLTWTSVTH